MQNYLLSNLEDQGVSLPVVEPGEITFRQFFDLTGVDLVLTGTNITQGQPRIFSLYFTPDFPVIEAIQISMTLPPIFKPVYVNTQVIKGNDASKLAYSGLYVDGGMLNNYPIRAFDNIKMSGSFQYLSGLSFRDNDNGGNGGFAIAADPFEASNECEGLMGMRLEEKVNEEIEITENASYPTDHLVFGRFLSEIYGTFMYTSEEGQIRSASDRKRTVSLYATFDTTKYFTERELLSLGRENATVYDNNIFSLGVSDFSTISLERKRGRISTLKAKEVLIEKARRDFLEFID